ncbi:hypothetical protein EW093_13670 [Thiospirochaeta perfilievii]|uniref:Aldehyde oxidase/xanthine dehydrogenase first molybdopterin binding domain-containing protein n=1 Tax=Thiospirochaeta perfilievii TaxID=252967 RepID=A0A5C1QGM0_9SPIO|nr:molybdopterin cofactor-binding domain-containing protein [Thiospirochaeta perfilievii]QEN05716.1 hypothetical protein EW093_13670 [Thiospirochaeta perfilievii]
MNKAEHIKLIYSGKYALPLDTATKKSYKILVYRSTVKRGLIENISLPEVEENYSIISSKDLKGKNFLKIDGNKIPILANKKVNYIGEPILLLVGPNISKLKAIHKKIEITYKIDIDQEVSDEIFFSKTIKIGDTLEAFTTPYKTLSGSIKTPKSVIESKYLLGSFTKREADSYNIYSSSIWEYPLRDNIANICGVESDKIKIVTPTTTGEDEYPLLDSYSAAAFTTISSSIIKKNVFYIPTPEDQYLYSNKLYGLEANWQIVFDSEDTVLGIKLDIKINCGAYPIFVKEKVLRVLHGVTSYYKHRNIEVTVTGYKSNLPPAGLSKDIYLADALFVAELLISKIIKESKKDQYLYRNENLIKKGYRNSTGSVIKRELPLDIMLKNVVEQSDFLRKNSSINLSLLRKEKRIHYSAKRGVGISVGYNGNGFISNEKNISAHSVVVELERNGMVELKVSCRINNLDLLTVWEDILVETLGIERENIKIFTEDLTMIMDSGPNIDNKNVTILTPLIKQCADEIKVRRFKDPLPIRQFKVTRKKSSNVWNYENWKGEPFKNSSYAACAVEVEIDKRSLSCIIKEIWIQLEVGLILNKQALLNSVSREINQTINWLQNSEPKERDGEFSTHYFYNKPLVKSNPIINISIYETGKNKNIPRGVGSLIRNTLPGAYIQGVNQAIGSNINTFPINKEMIYKELIKDDI